MNDLDKLCKGPSAGLTLDQIMSHCNSYRMVWGLSGAKIGMIIAGALLIGLLVLLDRILQEKADADVTVFNTLEGLVYGGLAVWAGSSAGATLALLLPPWILGLMLVVFAVLALLMMIAATIKGTGTDGNKALGVVCLMALTVTLLAAAKFAFRVPTSGPAGNAYETYLWAMEITFASTALAGAWVVSIFRGYHWAAGWLLVPLNASWGLFGNLLGLMNHLACLFFYKDSGKVQDTRLLYVLYEDGFHLRSGYDFTLGDAMSSNKVEKHESVHVFQHFIGGPIYPLSYALWASIFFIPGIIAGAVTSGRNVAEGITDLCYYNCPWEVIAYAVDGTGNDGNDTLIFNEIVGWIITGLWVAGALAAEALLLREILCRGR